MTHAELEEHLLFWHEVIARHHQHHSVNEFLCRDDDFYVLEHLARQRRELQRFKSGQVTEADLDRKLPLEAQKWIQKHRQLARTCHKCRFDPANDELFPSFALLPHRIKDLLDFTEVE